ncbi:MAG: phosphodiester glycosidase family protein [Chloroflexota bacterium]|nr:phosphodiester glycosidase family protein [Chloroflexota bacterium]
MSATTTGALRPLVAAVFVLAGVLAPALSVRAALTAPFSAMGEDPVAPGVIYRWGSAQADNGPQVVRVAEVDPAQSGIHFRTSLPRDKVNAREKTTSQALRYSTEGRRVVAALNGPTFNSYPGTHYSARGLNVQDGELTSLNVRGGVLSTFAVDTRGRARIGVPTVSVTVTVPSGATGSVNRVNAGRMPGETSIFTPRFDTHTWTGDDGDEYILEGVALPLRLTGTYSGTVVGIRRGLGDAPIGAGQVVLSASGEKAQLYAGLEMGDKLTISTSIESGWDDTVHAIGAKQLIVYDGRVDIRPYDLNDITYAHPRSVVGITGSGKVLMVAVEGRSTVSAGLRLDDLAQLMVDMGAVAAINLDGGGSTTLALRRPGDHEVSVANALSGGGSTDPGEERTVSNTLQVISTFPTGPLSTLLVAPAQKTLAVGQTQQYVAKGHDTHYNGVTPGPAAWSVSGGATISDSGLLTAESTGDYTVRARSGDHSATGALTIIAPVTPPTVPTGLTAVAEPNRIIKLSWNASTASVEGTIRYRVFRDGVAIGTKQTALTYTDQPTAGVHYYQVRAIDAAGNKSALSPSITVTAYTTPPPSVPTGLTGVPKPNRYVKLSWNASTAWVEGTIRYRVFRDGVAIGTKQTALTYTDRPTAGKHYYQVRAIDAAGNKSALSPPITVTAAP